MNNNAEQPAPERPHGRAPGGRGRGRRTSDDNQPMRRPHGTSPQTPASPPVETENPKRSSLSVDAKEFIPMAQSALPIVQTAVPVVQSSPPVLVHKISVQDRLQIAREDSNVPHVMLQRQQDVIQQLNSYHSTPHLAGPDLHEAVYLHDHNSGIPPYGQYYGGAGDYNSEIDTDEPQIDLDSSLMQLDHAINILTMNPGKFDSLIAQLVDNISPFLDDPYCCQEILKRLINQSIYEGNFRYSGARLCTHFDTVALTADNTLSVFRKTLLTQCQQETDAEAEIWQQIAKHSPDTEKKCHGLIYFLAELVMQMEPIASELGKILIHLMNTVLLNPAASSTKNICQALKLAGSTLERDVSNRAGVSQVFQNLTQLVMKGKVNTQVGQIVNSVSELRNGNWGIQSSNASAHIDNASQLPSSLADETIYYGPDGQVITEEENRFLQDSVESNSSQELLEGDEMDDEIAAAYEEFLEYSANKQTADQNSIRSGDFNSH